MKSELKGCRGAVREAVLWGGGLATAAFAVALQVAPLRVTAQEPATAQQIETSLALVERHLMAGEYSSARKIASRLSGAEADRARAAIAQRLSAAGLTTAAIADWEAIDSPAASRDTAAFMLGRGRSASGYGNTSGYGTDPLNAGYENNDDGGAAAFGGAGGGAIADFSQLMNLIQTTIAPDQWQDLGGPSTMFPYPAGIYVDPDGLVRDIEIAESDRRSSLASLSSLGRLNEASPSRESQVSSENTDWTQPANLRIVSLKRLRQHYLRSASTVRPLTLEMQNLAGLSTLQYVIIEDNDVLLAGPVGGIDPAASPWPRDLTSNKTTFGLDLLIASACAVVHGAPYGCTIDPTQEGLQAAAKVSVRIASRNIAPALAADALADAVGHQNIELFNVPADQPLAWLLVEADRHMKQLALGQHPMPRGVSNYLDVVEAAVRRPASDGVPSGQLLRMWFAGQPKSIRRAPNSETFELDGQPLRLITAKEFSDSQGERIRAGEDPLGQQFADGFNQHFDSIAAMYPVYDRLRGAFELTAAVQLVKTQVEAEKLQRLLGELAITDVMFTETHAVPKQCESLAVRHTVRTQTQRHEVYIVSGGIRIDPAESLVSRVTTYPMLDSLEIESSDAPVYNTRWWWDR